MPLLKPDDPFAELTITTADDQTLTLPGAFAGDFSVVLLYRGAWCPYCNAQLRAFERAGQALAGNGIRVAALSSDGRDATAALVARHEHHNERLTCGYVIGRRSPESGTGCFAGQDHGGSSRAQVAER
jgi:peroxiredoxin